MASSPASSRPVFVITGPSGAGKGTLERELLRRVPGKLEPAVSATTRPRRAGEADGVDYWFVDDAEFDRLAAGGRFLEWVTYVSGHRYGTLRSEIDRIRRRDRSPLLDLEIRGALAVRDGVPGSIAVFVDAPPEELERRLRERATESSGEIDERVALAREQREHADEFDYVVENDDLERAAAELTAIVVRALDAAATIART